MFKKLLIVLLLPFLAISQQSITGQFDPNEGYTFGILYRITPDNVFYITDARIKADGSFTLAIKEPIAPGMHRIVYNLPQDQFFFDFIYNGKEDIEFTFSNEKGAQFTASKENKMLSEFKSGLYNYGLELNTLLGDEKINKKQVNAVLKMQTEWYNELLVTAEEMLAINYIKAYQPILDYEFTDIASLNTTLQNNHLAHLDFNNTLLQNSTVPLERILTYVFNFKEEDNPKASMQANIDAVAKAIAVADKKYQKSLLDSMWDFLSANEQIAAANHLGTSYLIPIATEVGDTKTIDKVQLYKNLSIGNKAPNFTWVNEEGDTPQSLHDLDPAEQYVITFWSSHCSHCLAEVPKLHKFAATQDKEVLTVVAVGLEEAPYDWKNETYNLPKFTHVLGLGKWENDIGNAYDVTATPTYFVLDGDMKITHKPETLEELLEILSAKE